MGVDFCVAPGNTNTVTGPAAVFTYGFLWGDGVAWSDDAIFRIVSDDGSETHDFKKGDGEAVEDLLVFTFTSPQPGLRYRGLIVEGDYTMNLFGVGDLCALIHPADPCCHLTLPDPDDTQGPSSQDDSGGSASAAADAPPNGSDDPSEASPSASAAPDPDPLAEGVYWDAADEPPTESTSDSSSGGATPATSDEST